MLFFGISTWASSKVKRHAGYGAVQSDFFKSTGRLFCDSHIFCLVFRHTSHTVFGAILGNVNWKEKYDVKLSLLFYKDQEDPVRRVEQGLDQEWNQQDPGQQRHVAAMITTLQQFVNYTRHIRRDCRGACIYACQTQQQRQTSECGNPAMIGGVIFMMREWAMSYIVMKNKDLVKEAFNAVRKK